jgi:hypothetical protein
MAVQEDNLGYGVPKLNRFIPATQTKHVAGVIHARDPGVRLTCFGLPTSPADRQGVEGPRTHWRKNYHQPCMRRSIPKKSKSPLVIPCKFSAVIYSERLSGTSSVATRVLPIFFGNKDLQSAGVSGAECKRTGKPSCLPITWWLHAPAGRTKLIAARYELLNQIVSQDLDAFGQWPVRRRYPVNSAERYRPIRQQPLKLHTLEWLLKEKFR